MEADLTITDTAQRSRPARIFLFLTLSCLVLATGRVASVFAPGAGSPSRSAGVPGASDVAAASRARIAFLEARIRRDPSDSDVYTKLAGLYLERLRATGALSDLNLAVRAARRSLAIVPAVRNADGLTALAMAEFASHEFGPARDHARQLMELDGTAAPYALLGDALAELGDYAQASRVYQQMWRHSGSDDENVATRFARLAQLRGDNAAATRSFKAALALELGRGAPSLERIAWFHWQLGDTAFFTGDVRTAEMDYNDALAAYPGYFRVLASLGRLKAAGGDFERAIALYGAAVRALPDPTFVAELGDVYGLSGDRKNAEAQYALVEFIGHLSRLNGVMYNRQLAMFYADHDFKTNEAYRDAKREYAVRRDILGADALAWTALKAGKLAEARAAMKAALRLGTQDPRLFYHAGMIARASGQRALSKTYLRRALALNPHFDPLQAVRAREALDSEADRPERASSC